MSLTIDAETTELCELWLKGSWGPITLERALTLEPSRRKRCIECLMVAAEELYPVFRRHGFEVSQTKMAQMAFSTAKKGFPYYTENMNSN